VSGSGFVTRRAFIKLQTSNENRLIAKKKKILDFCFELHIMLITHRIRLFMTIIDFAINMVPS